MLGNLQSSATAVIAPQIILPSKKRWIEQECGDQRALYGAGMQEAHIYASGCLRLLSLVPENKPLLMDAGVHRYIAHLLDGNVDLSRWHARQTLLNLAMVPEFAATLALYELPDFVTGSNLPKPPLSACRPHTAPATLQGVLRPYTLNTPFNSSFLCP